MVPVMVLLIALFGKRFGARDREGGLEGLTRHGLAAKTSHQAPKLERAVHGASRTSARAAKASASRRPLRPNY